MPSNPFKAEPSTTRVALNRIGLRVRNIERRVQTSVASAPFTPFPWQRTTEPLISPSVSWENGAVQEPDVHFESGTYKMWFTAGESSGGMGYASCSSDPTVAANWTKYASNPVLGQGGSSVSGFVAGINIIKVAGVYHCFYYDAIGGGNLKRSTSTDGLSWTTPTTAISSGAISGTHGWANSTIWHDGTNWWLFVEASVHSGGGDPWGSYLFKNSSISGDGSWVVQNSSAGLTSLEVSGYDDGYGQGPNIAEIDGELTLQIGAANLLWCHASKSGSPVTSDIMHATTTDPGLVSWTPGSPFDIIHNGGPFEPSQAADPCVLEVAGASFLFFSGQDAASFDGVINLATFAGTLKQFLNGSQGGGTTAEVTSSGGTVTVTNPNGPTVNIDLPETGVSAGSYGDASHVAEVTVDAEGRITAASNVPVAGGTIYGPLTNPGVPDLIFTAAGDVILAPD